MALWWSDDMEILEELPSTGIQALGEAIRSKPDVALVDYWMPEMNGPSVASALLDESAPTKVILLSWVYGFQEINTALHSGAVGFLTKNVHVPKVAEAIRRAHAGEAPVFREDLEELAEKLKGRADKVGEMRRRMANLTPREMTVLGLLGKGRSGAEIARELKIAPHTVSLHIHNLVRKSEAETKEQAVGMARYCGMIST